MIMQWKHEGEDYVASWQGIQFLLTEDRATRRWRLWADGRLVNQTWTKARAAMDRIDARQQRLIMAAVRPAAGNGGAHAAARA